MARESAEKRIKRQLEVARAELEKARARVAIVEAERGPQLEQLDQRRKETEKARDESIRNVYALVAHHAQQFNRIDVTRQLAAHLEASGISLVHVDLDERVNYVIEKMAHQHPEVLEARKLEEQANQAYQVAYHGWSRVESVIQSERDAVRWREREVEKLEKELDRERAAGGRKVNTAEAVRAALQTFVYQPRVEPVEPDKEKQP